MSELTKNFDASLLDKLENVVVYGYIAEEHFKSLLSSVVGEKITEKMNNGSIKFKFIGEQFEKKKSDSTTLVVITKNLTTLSNMHHSIGGRHGLRNAFGFD